MQNYGVGGISYVIHDVTTMICVITQDNSVTTMCIPGPSPEQCVWGGTKNSQTRSTDHKQTDRDKLTTNKLTANQHFVIVIFDH